MADDVSLRRAGYNGMDIAVSILLDDAFRKVERIKGIGGAVLGIEKMSNAQGVFRPETVNDKCLPWFNGNLVIYPHRILFAVNNFFIIISYFIGLSRLKGSLPTS